jgi:HSP20 family protein
MSEMRKEGGREISLQALFQAELGLGGRSRPVRIPQVDHGPVVRQRVPLINLEEKIQGGGDGMSLGLTPWRSFTPFRELERMREEMDRLWDSFFERREDGEEIGWLPAIDISETKDAILVKAELLGMEAKDIDISFSGEVLTFKGEKRMEKEQKDESYHMLERSYGTFSRSVRVPHEVQGDKIAARCKDGVLSVTLPKSDRAGPKEIRIKAE